MSTKTVRIGQRSLTNHNKLLWQVEGAEGVKTGYTKAAGRILVSSASRAGRRLICVTINDGNDWADHAALLNDGFSRYKVEKIVEEGEILGSFPVLLGTETEVEVAAAEEFSFAVAQEETVRVVLPQGFVYAPVVMGSDAGFAYVLIGEEVVGKIPLVFTQTIELQPRDEKKYFWEGWFHRD